MPTYADETAAIKSLPTAELRRIVESAIGRVFGMMQRKGRAGDIEEYSRCKHIAMACGDELRNKGEL